MNSRTIGFIGLGQMGKPMSKNLLKKGFELVICGHTRKEPVEELKTLGARVVSSPKEVAKASDIVIIMVRDTPQAEEVIQGKGEFWEQKGVWQGIENGSTLIICSTLEPSYCQKISKEGAERGVGVLDCPVSGGPFASEAGTLSLMVGGDKGLFEKMYPLLEAMGGNIFYLGGSGMGEAFKLVNNYMMAITAFGTSEAIAIGLKFGLKLERILEVVKVCSGNSRIIQDWDLMMLFKKDRKNRATGGLFFKDIMLGIKLGEDLGAPVHLGRFVSQMDASALFPTESV